MVTIDDKVANCRDVGDALEAKLNATTLQQNFAKLGISTKIVTDSKIPSKIKLIHINTPRISEGDGSIDVNNATWPPEAVNSAALLQKTDPIFYKKLNQIMHIQQKMWGNQVTNGKEVGHESP